MRKLIALFALVLVFTMATSAYAEVQNVKVSGELRTRAYWVDNLNDLNDEGDPVAGDDDYGWIDTRARVTVEADLTDNVLTVITLEAEGAWGEGQAVDMWDVVIDEAFVQLSELYYSPLTVKIGRQKLNFGRGFIISDAELFWSFDAVRATLDFYPWTIDGVASKLVETYAVDDDADMFGVNVRFAADLWDVEAYLWSVIDKSDANVQPMPLGIRGDITPIEALDIWGEATYEFGEFGNADIVAWAINAGATFTFAMGWEPSVSVQYVFGSGDANPSTGDYEAYVELFEYDYWGYAYSPYLSNIHIINASLSVLPLENLTLVVDWYYYLQDKKAAMIMGDPLQDNGGVLATTNGLDEDLGMELDLVAEYDYSEDVSTQLIAAFFFPGDAYGSNDDTAYEIRGEILVSF